MYVLDSSAHTPQSHRLGAPEAQADKCPTRPGSHSIPDSDLPPRCRLPACVTRVPFHIRCHFLILLVSFDRIGFPSWLHFSIPAWPRVVLVSRQHHHHQSRRRPRPASIAHAARLEPVIHFAVPPRSDPTLAVVVALLSSAGKGGAQGHPLLRWLAPLPSFCSFRRCAGLDLRARGLFACCPAVPSVCPVLSLTLFRGRALFRFRRTLLLLLLG